MAKAARNRVRERELLGILARAFAELGYRRATTAELARRCGVQETILYRVWPGKREMFVAAIEHVFAESSRAWETLLRSAPDAGSVAQRILAYEASHHGEHRLYRLVFAGLSECDDPPIRAALRRMYGRFQRFVAEQVAGHRGAGAGDDDVARTAWAILGLGTVANIANELGLLGARERARLIEQVGGRLLEAPR